MPQVIKTEADVPIIEVIDLSKSKFIVVTTHVCAAGELDDESRFDEKKVEHKI